MFDFDFDSQQFLAASADIAVVVLLSPDNQDSEFVPIRPRALRDADLDALQMSGRRLRYVGVLGLVGGVAHCQLVEPLTEQVTAALAQGFATYVHHFHAGDAAEIAALEALHRLDDPRPEA